MGWFGWFYCFWGQIIGEEGKEKEKKRKRELLTILGTSNLLYPKIAEVLGGLGAPAGNQEQICCLGSVSSHAGSFRGGVLTLIHEPHSALAWPLSTELPPVLSVTIYPGTTRESKTLLPFQVFPQLRSKLTCRVDFCHSLHGSS